MVVVVEREESVFFYIDDDDESNTHTQSLKNYVSFEKNCELAQH